MSLVLPSSPGSPGARPLFILGEALMDCVAQPDGLLRPLVGGSPYNVVRAAALQADPERVRVGYLNPLSRDTYGQALTGPLRASGAILLGGVSDLPTSLAVVQVNDGTPSYSFYREGVADRDYTVDSVIQALQAFKPGVLHTGSLALIPPEHDKVLAILRAARAAGWIISVDVNLRTRVAPDLDAYRAAVAQAVALADWVKASDEDLLTLQWCESAEPADWPALAQALHARGPRHVALTGGPHGAALSMASSAPAEGQPSTPIYVQHAAWPIVVRDTVGAGDTFWASCLVMWLTHGAGQDHEQARAQLQRALVAAAINCQREGCAPPTTQEVEAALTSRAVE